MPRPNTKAPAMSDGPIGAMAPPKPGTNAAAGTMAAAAIAISSRPPRKPSAWPRTIKRRHDAVKLNSALRNTAPSAKPRMSSAAAAGCPSITTSATSTASARDDATRNGQSRPGRRAAAADGVAATLMRFPSRVVRGLGAEPQCLLQIVEARARARDRTTRIGAPLDHRAWIEPYVGPAQHSREHKPVGRRPVSGVAIGHNRTGRQLGCDPGELVLWTEPIGRRIVEGRAVEIDRARNMTVSLGGRGLFLAIEIAHRASIDERGV